MISLQDCAHRKILGAAIFTTALAATVSRPEGVISVKIKMLGVDEFMLQHQGAVSEPCAEAMAIGIRNLAEADIGIGITGIAGPGGGTDEGMIRMQKSGCRIQTPPF